MNTISTPIGNENQLISHQYLSPKWTGIPPNDKKRQCQRRIDLSLLCWRKISQRCLVNSRLANSWGGDFWNNFLRERRRVVSNYEQAKFMRKGRGAANNFRRCFAFLLIFAENVDFPCCYFSPKLKITRTVDTTIKKELTLFARWVPLPPSQGSREKVRP